MENITIQDVLQQLHSVPDNSAELIDVRQADEFEKGHVPGARNIPLMGVLLNADKFFIRNKLYYLICQSGGRSLYAAEHLAELGFTVANVLGGVDAYWEYIEKRSLA